MNKSKQRAQPSPFFGELYDLLQKHFQYDQTTWLPKLCTSIGAIIRQHPSKTARSNTYEACIEFLEAIKREDKQ